MLETGKACALKVDKAVERIKQACRQEAKQGKNSMNDLWVFLYLDDWEARKAFLQWDLEVKLAALGFKRVQVFHDPSWQGSGLSVSVEWEAPEPPGASTSSSQGSNLVLECGVCSSERPMLRVSPCGHLVCQICSQEILRLARCPFCRKAVAEVLSLFQP